MLSLGCREIILRPLAANEKNLKIEGLYGHGLKSLNRRTTRVEVP